ncbi:MAG: regulatory protein RecX [Gemmatimonadota bacterium]
MDKALELLSFRARSESELERRILRAGHAPSAAASALRRCRELGYIDDRAFALAHVRDRLRLRPKGRRALRSELYRKGVDGDLAEAAIDEAFAELGIDETALARRLAGKRVKALGRLETETARRRLTGYLVRRGFSPPVVRAAVAEALPARGTGSPEASSRRVD